jgi:hypothetical protein
MAVSGKPQGRKPLVVTTYDNLRSYIESFKNSQMSLLIIIGGPGLGKTQIVKRVLGDDLCLIEGGVSAYHLYRNLFLKKNKLVVIDDVDNLHRDSDCVGLLKCLCQTNPVKRLQWNKRMTRLDRLELEPEFETTSRAIIVSNDWKTINKNVASLEDRGHVLSFEPSMIEMHRYVGTWFHDKEVYAWYADNLFRLDRLSFRDYIRASELRSSGMEWPQGIEPVRKHKRGPLVAELLSDPSYPDMKSRLTVFMRKGGGSPSTFWNYVKKYREETGS